jgi:bifunctional non-homologous end joining protein LigD
MKKKAASQGRTASRKREKTLYSVANVPQAIRAALPPQVRPALATHAPSAPEGDQWLHEIKFDGYRMICRIDQQQVQFLSRNAKDWTDKLGEIVAASGSLPVQQAILDGEVVAFAADGTTSFQALQNAIGQSPGEIAYYVFDLIYLDGYDLTHVRLDQRKELLATLLSASSSAEGRIQYSDHVVGDGPHVFAEACKMGVEGIISKRRDRPYRPGRTTNWLKIKCLQREEFVVGGFTNPSSSRVGFGALLLGYYDPRGKLVYAGRVGTGFTEQTLRDLHRRLRSRETKESPFEVIPPKESGRDVHWVQPELVVQVEFASWTGDGVLRHPSYQGLREDKFPREVVRDWPPGASEKSTPTGGSIAVGRSRRSEVAEMGELRFTNPERIVFPQEGITKLGLATYYVEVADWMLPHVIDRPLSLLRCPSGQQGTCFYQKHPPAGLPDAVGRLEIRDGEEKETLLTIHDLAGLLSLVQFGVLEFHPWGSRSDDIEKPDRLVFDIDPDPTVPWRRVVVAALEMRKVLDELALKSFVKTTGGKGLHVVVPLTRRHPWSDVKRFSQQFAQTIAAREPASYTTNSSKAARRGKIYLDYLRNTRGATAIAPYSTRARPSAPIAVPLDWEELETLRGPDQFTLKNLRRRLTTVKRDPWEQIFATKQFITQAAWNKLMRLNSLA